MPFPCLCFIFISSFLKFFFDFSERKKIEYPVESIIILFNLCAQFITLLTGKEIRKSKRKKSKKWGNFADFSFQRIVKMNFYIFIFGSIVNPYMIVFKRYTLVRKTVQIQNESTVSLNSKRLKKKRISAQSFGAFGY